MIDREWADWPWQQCQAVTIDEYGRCRCDLRRGHEGQHRAERGMYDVVWTNENWLEMPMRVKSEGWKR